MCIVAAGVVFAGVVVRVGVGVASQPCLLRGFFSRGPLQRSGRCQRKMAADKSVARSVHTASTLYFLPIGAFMRDAGQRDAEHFSVKTKDATKRCLCEFAGLRLEHGEPL